MTSKPPAASGNVIVNNNDDNDNDDEAVDAVDAGDTGAGADVDDPERDVEAGWAAAPAELPPDLADELAPRWRGRAPDDPGETVDDRHWSARFQRLLRRPVLVSANGFSYRGRLMGADENDLYLRGMFRWYVIALDRIRELSLDEETAADEAQGESSGADEVEAGAFELTAAMAVDKDDPQGKSPGPDGDTNDENDDENDDDNVGTVRRRRGR